jgi:hypothetical protein
MFGTNDGASGDNDAFFCCPKQLEGLFGGVVGKDTCCCGPKPGRGRVSACPFKVSELVVIVSHSGLLTVVGVDTISEYATD